MENGLIYFLLGDKKGNLIVIKNEKQKDFDSCFYPDHHGGLITDIKVNTSYNEK